MYEVSDDLDNFTCEICFMSCPTDHEYISHTNLCREVRKEKYTKTGKLDIANSGIHVLFEKFSHPADFQGISDDLINVNNIERALYRFRIGDQKIIQYKVLLQRDIIHCMSKIIRKEYTCVNKMEQPVIVSYFTGRNLRLYEKGKWEEDLDGERFRKEVVDKLVEQFKASATMMLKRFEELRQGKFSKWNIRIDDEKLKKMIEEKKIDMRYFNKVMRCYKAAIDQLDTPTLSAKILSAIYYMLFHVDVYTARKAIVSEQNDQKKSNECGEDNVKNV